MNSVRYYFGIIISLVVILQACNKEEEPVISLPEITTSEPSNITSSSADTGGNITDNGGAEIALRGVVWNTSKSPSLATNLGRSENGSGMGEFTSIITDLSPGITYYVRAYATNSLGTAYGQDVGFTTSVELAGITTAEITDITSGSATSGGDVTQDGGSTITKKGIVWHTEENPTFDNHTGKTEHGEGTGSFVSYLTDLGPATTYYVCAYATNTEGTAYGDQQSFETLADLATVVTNSVDSITYESAKVFSSITSNGGADVFERGVVWSKDENPELENNLGVTQDGEGMGEYSSILENLSPETVYYVRAYATNQTGTSYGEEITFTTLQMIDIPVVITGDVSDITHESAILEGNVTQSGGAAVIERGIVFSTDTDPSLNDQVIKRGRGLGNYLALISGLEPETTYYAKAYAINTVGIAYGNQIEFTTYSEYGQHCPGIPQITDIDGNVYNTVLIGDQCWMKEDMKAVTLNDGTPIENAISETDWENNTNGAYAWYENNEEGHKPYYGAIYNWHVVHTEKICPSGWRVPSEQDWIKLSDYMTENFEDITAENEGNMLKSCRQVNSPLDGECATDEHPRWDEHNIHFGIDKFGFSAVPGGSRNWTGNYFYGHGIIGYWWSSTEVDADIARYRRIYHEDGILLRHQYSKNNGYNIRCMRDD